MRHTLTHCGSTPDLLWHGSDGLNMYDSSRHSSIADDKARLTLPQNMTLNHIRDQDRTLYDYASSISNLYGSDTSVSIPLSQLT